MASRMQRACSFRKRSRRAMLPSPPRGCESVCPPHLQRYGETDPFEIQRVLDSFRNFMELCERKEAETREPCRITASY